MSYQGPGHFQGDASTPPLPPPKPSAHSSGRGTPLLLSASAQTHAEPTPSLLHGQHPLPDSRPQHVVLPEEGWLPDAVRDKNTADLQALLEKPELQEALVYSPESAHPAIDASTAPLCEALAANVALAESLKSLESHLRNQRQLTQSRLLSLRALEAQWRSKQAEQDAVLKDFSPPALYQRLSASIAEQEELCRGLEESFLEGEGGGQASEREVADFVRRIRDGRKIAYLRRERKERWDEGRVGGWR